jgi:hypothetical protein
MDLINKSVFKCCAALCFALLFFSFRTDLYLRNPRFPNAGRVAQLRTSRVRAKSRCQWFGMLGVICTIPSSFRPRKSKLMLMHLTRAMFDIFSRYGCRWFWIFYSMWLLDSCFIIIGGEGWIRYNEEIYRRTSSRLSRIIWGGWFIVLELRLLEKSRWDAKSLKIGLICWHYFIERES